MATSGCAGSSCNEGCGSTEHSDLRDWLQKVARFTLEGHSDSIRCPVLAETRILDWLDEMLARRAAAPYLVGRRSIW
jgi:hypothetical protein